MNPAEWAILEAALPGLQIALAKKDTSVTINMSEFRRATIFEKGDASVDIREWYSGADGSLKPGQKGVALSQDSFQVCSCPIHTLLCVQVVTYIWSTSVDKHDVTSLMCL